MTKYVINGGKTLNGEVTISGAKNAAVAIVPAALLADGPVRLENVPKIIDVTLQMEIMRELGAQIRQINATTVEIQNTQNPSLKPHELERKLRARGLHPYFITGHTGWTDNLEFAFAHKDKLCSPFKKRVHDPSAPYDAYDESDDTEENAKSGFLKGVGR